MPLAKAGLSAPLEKVSPERVASVDAALTVIVAVAGLDVPHEFVAVY